MIRHRLTLLALGAIVTALALPSPASAQNDFAAFYNHFRFYELGLSARSAGMGGAYSALSGGEMGLLGNPASLGFSEKPYLMLNFIKDEVTSDLSLLSPLGAGTSRSAKTEADIFSVGPGFSYPFEWGAVGIQYNYRKDDIDSDPFNFPFGSYGQGGNLERHSVSVGAGYRFTDQWAVGYRYSYITWDSDTSIAQVRPLPVFQLAAFNEDFEGHRNQFGAQYRMNDQMTFGLDGYFGLGDRSSAVLGKADTDSWAVRGGVAWNVCENLPLLVAMDVNFENRELKGGGNKNEEDLFGVHLGAEYKLSDNFFLRAGYQLESFDYDDKIGTVFESPTIGGYTAGLGFAWKNLTLDYGFIYSDTGSGDLTHVIGVGYHF